VHQLQSFNSSNHSSFMDCLVLEYDRHRPKDAFLPSLNILVSIFGQLNENLHAGLAKLLYGCISNFLDCVALA
jgi:hypothetical protein